MAELDNKVALVTGAGRGIGRAVSLELAKRGAKVALLARSANEIEGVAKEIRQIGGEALVVQADLSQVKQVSAEIVKQVTSKLGEISILVNNAAVVGPFGVSWEVEPGQWVKALEINLVAPFYLSREVLAGMRQKGWGRIINVSSGAARNPMAQAGAYSVTKSGLDMFSRQLGQELEGSGVSVISVYPGVVDTEMQNDIRQQPVEKVGEELATRFKEYYEKGHLQSPDLPGKFIAALTGEAVAKLNGKIVDIYDSQYQYLLTDSPSQLQK